MGVVAFFTAITKEQLASFLDDPDSLRAFREHNRSFMDIDKAQSNCQMLWTVAASGGFGLLHPIDKPDPGDDLRQQR